MSLVANIDVSLRALTTDFVGPMKGAEKAVDSFNKKASEKPSASILVSGKLGALLGALRGDFIGLANATVEYGKSFLNMSKDQFEAIDNLAKMADKLGSTTEAMAGLQHAASLSGVSNEELSKSLQTMQKTIAEAAGGSQQAADKLGALGLSAEQLLGMSLEDRFGAIGDSIRGMGDQAGKITSAMAVMGDGGVSALNLLKDGSKGLKDAIEEAKALGLAVSREDAAKVEAANDAWTRMGAAVQGVGRSLAVALAPTVDTVLTAMEFGIRNWKDVGMLVIEQLSLRFVTFGNDVVHLSTTVIPQAFSSAWELIKSIFSGESLSDVWVRELQKMKDSVSRTRTDLERSLQSSIDERSERLGKNWADILSARSRAMKGPGPDVKSAMERVEKMTAGFAERGSREAADIIAKAMQASRGGTGGETEKDILKRMFEQGREEMRAILAIERNTRKGGGAIEPAAL